MNALMLGVLVVGVFAGIVLGRDTEKARRGYKDYGVAKAAMPKFRSTATAAIRKAVGTVVIWGAILVALFVMMMTVANKSS